MEAMNMIMTALTTGITVAAEGTATQAVKDAYNGLKTLIKERFSKKPDKEAAKDAEKTLEKYEADPETYEKPLQKELSTVGAEQDQAILDMAQKLLDLLGKAQEKSGVSQTITTDTVGTQTNIGQAAGDVNIGTKKE